LFFFLIENTAQVSLKMRGYFPQNL